MMWLLRRVGMVWLILGVICAGVVGIARANGGQDKLQAMGFGLCDGEPCFRGIKSGMDWSKTESWLPDAAAAGPAALIFKFGKPDRPVHIFVYPSQDSKTIGEIQLEALIDNEVLTVGDIVRRFGYPCYVGDGSEAGTGGIILSYPKFIVVAFYKDMRLSLDAPVWILRSPQPSQTALCRPGLDDEYNGPWRGFTSREAYLARNRRDLKITPTP